jgi:signal transduction histidine kinase/CheY-like chemotaxis protein/ligand-binding sensor domain-containing protein
VSRRSCQRSVYLVLALALATTSCWAASGSGPRYSFRHYGAETGLGNQTILSLLQDHRGYLWVGTEAGLYRYNGSRFRLMGASDGLACLAEVRGLAETEDGSLWVIACNHLYRSSAGRFELTTQRDVVTNSLQAITGDGEGGVLVGIADGLLQASSHRDEEGHLAVRMFPLPEALTGRPVRGVYRDGTKLWFACDRALYSLQAGKLTHYGTEDGLAADDWDAIMVTPTGDLWLRSAKLTCWRPHGQARFRTIPGVAPSFLSGFLGWAGDGSVLIPTTNGLALVNSRGVQTVGDKQGLHTSLTSVAIKDRQGSIWVGLFGEGLARWLGQTEWEAWTKDEGLPSNLVWNIIRARSDGALWVGTAQGVVRYPKQGVPRVWSWAQNVNGTVRWLREARDGAIWLITQGDTVGRINPLSGEVKFFGRAQGLTAGHPLRGCFDHEGRLWLATSSGLFVATQPTASAHFEFVPGSPKGLWDVAEDKRGALFATTAHGLWRYGNGHWLRYGKKDGLLSDSTYVIAVAPDGALWLRHRYDGIVERVTFDGERVASVSEIKPDGVPTELTALHGFDSLGRYWQGTPNGLSMLADPAGYLAAARNPGAAKETAKKAWRHFTTEDGLISNDCDGEAFWADEDGSIWIGTSGGLSHYSPHESPLLGALSTDSPVITDIQVSQQPRFARIEFSSLNFVTESLTQFAYSIDGGNWIDAKERTVTLAALRPGQHQFRVRMRTWGHNWSKQTAETQFRFEPFWWETWWATFGLWLLLTGTGFGLLCLWLNMQRRRTKERSDILAAKASAEAASQAKSLFLAHMSHEIRTPLHQILGLIEDLAARKMPEDTSDVVSQLRSSSSGLFELLDGVLDFSKIEAGKLEIQKAAFDLRSCLDASMTLFSKSAAEKGISFTLDSDSALPRDVLGDAMRLRQVLVCLISNAVKFTHQGEVRLQAKITAAEAQRSTIRFSIVDTGIGIPEERLSRLFCPFTQGDASTSRTHGGTGLGLTIARSLILLMGGDTLAVESRAGGGTSFAFSISFDHAISQEKKPSATAFGLSKMRILVVEDNKINQKIMLNLLARMGYKADLAVDGAEAIEAVTRQTYDVILMDIQMPKVDGLQATREIRNYFAGQRQPRIFAVTAHATTDDRDLCMAAGMDGYLTKPVNQELLNRTLEEASELESCAVPPNYDIRNPSQKAYQASLVLPAMERKGAKASPHMHWPRA